MTVLTGRQVRITVPDWSGRYRDWSVRVLQLERRRGGRGVERPHPAAEHDGEDPQPVLVDQVVPFERADERAAAGDEGARLGRIRTSRENVVWANT